MFRVFAFIAPGVLWIFLMRDFVFGIIPVNMDTNTIYGVTKFYFNNVLNGVIPLWEPFVSLGRPFYAIAICNLFNPVTLLVPILKVIGINYAQAFVAYMVVYFFIGCGGFYLLALEIFKDRRMAYLAYLGLLFSSFGASMFTQFTFLEMVVPAIWFFFFLLRFASQPKQGYLLGLIFSSMVLISSYLPFYFGTVFLTFLVIGITLYYREVKNSWLRIYPFLFKHWRLCLFCLIGIILAAGPLLAYKVLDGSGDVVAPGRHCQYTSLQECYDRTMERQGGMSYEEITRSGTLGERVDMQYLFGNLDKITYGSDSFFFLPIGVYILLGLSLILPLRRITILLSAMIAAIGIIASGHVTGLFGFLYHHVFLFTYFRNLFFLGAFLMPMLILLAVFQLQMLFDFKNLSFVGDKRGKVLAIVFLHAMMFIFLQHFEGVPFISYATLILSALFWTISITGIFHLSPKTMIALLSVLLMLQPVWVLHAYALNAREFAAVLPSMHVKPDFSWVRPEKPAVSNFRIYQFVPYEDFWYDMSMTDAPAIVGYPQSTTRWTFDLSVHTPANVLANYAQYKIILYDDQGSSAQPLTGSSAQVMVDYYDVNTLRLKTNFLSPKILVYNDSYTTSWKAFIDGENAGLMRANQAFKGIKVPAGEHIVEFSYHPPGDRWVYIVATLALLIFLLWLILMLYWSL